MNKHLIELGDKMQEIVAGNVAYVDVLFTYISKRIDHEKHFSEELCKLLANLPKMKSGAFSLITDEINSIIIQHKIMSERLSTKVLGPIKSFKDKIIVKQREINNTTKIGIENVNNITRKLTIIKANLDKAKYDALHISHSKAEKSRKLIRGLEHSFNTTKEEHRSIIENLNEVVYPDLMDEIGKMDLSVKQFIKETILDIISHEYFDYEKTLIELNSVNISAKRYEPLLENLSLTKSLGFCSKYDQTFAITLCDYYGSDSNDLSFGRGQIIEIIKKHPSGWWEGTCDNRTGLFPMTYVDIIEAKITSDTILVDAEFEAESSFIATEEGQISIDLGDIVHIYKVTGGWCEGYHILHQIVGKFPTKVIRGLRNSSL